MNLPLFSLHEGIDALLWYHYAGLGVVLALFLMFLALGIAFFKKRFTAFAMFSMALLIFIAGPTLAVAAIEDRIRSVELTDLNITTLVYSPIIVISGTIKSETLIPIEKEFYKVKITRINDNWFLNVKNYFQPITTAYFVRKTFIDQNESAPFELDIDYGDKIIPKRFNVYISYKAL